MRAAGWSFRAKPSTPSSARRRASGRHQLNPGAPPRLRSILLGSIGNLIEWYDFYAYAAFALYFSPSFFPSADQTAQLMATAAIFALGFVVRPIGAVLFGYLGDRYGRKAGLMASVFLMCLGSLLIAVAPTHAMVGDLAPVILLAARLIQGISLGGEYGTSATYLSEMASARHRGFYASFQYVTILFGQLAALLLLLFLQRVALDARQLSDWGWRIPFAVGAALALVAVKLRSDLAETEAYQRAAARGQAAEGAQGPLSAFRRLMHHRREAALVIGLTMGGTLAFYMYTTYMQKLLKLSVGLSDGETTLVAAASIVFAMLLQPAYGALSDRIGRRPLLLGFGVLGTLCTVPLLAAIRAAHGPWEALALVCAGWLIVSGYTSINAIVKAELFPASLRATGVGVPYAIAVSLFGGSAEYVALWFKHRGIETGFDWYATAVIAVSLAVYATMRDTRAASALDRDGRAGAGS